MYRSRSAADSDASADGVGNAGRYGHADADGYSELDGDCDGSVTDIEFFRALDLELPEGGERGAFLANPKLRRQVPGPLPLFALPAQKGCLPHDVPNYRGVERLDARVYVTHEALRPGEPLLWDGRAIPASSLQLVPCENDVGQCFREYEP